MMSARQTKIRKSKLHTEDQNYSDSEINYSFEARPRVEFSPKLTRSRALAIARQQKEQQINMSIPTGNSENPQATLVVNDFAEVASHLERVLTLNHNSFMSELSTLRTVLGGHLNSNPVRGNREQVAAGNNTAADRTNDQSLANSSHSSLNSSSSHSSFRIDKWNISYDGSQDISDFLFKVDTLKSRTGYPSDQVVANFHTFLKGKAEVWFWSYLKQNPNTSYDELKSAIQKQYGKIENDCDKIVRMVERRQMPKESFDDFFTEMISMNSKLSTPLNDTKIIELVKDNVKESLGALLFSHDFYSLEHLREAARKAEKYIARQNQLRNTKRYVSEIDSLNIEKEVVETEGEIAAFKYQNSQRERKEIDTSKFKCWNCDHIGHSYYECPSKTRILHCFRCGEKNVTTLECTKHSKNRSMNE